MWTSNDTVVRTERPLAAMAQAQDTLDWIGLDLAKWTHVQLWDTHGIGSFLSNGHLSVLATDLRPNTAEYYVRHQSVTPDDQSSWSVLNDMLHARRRGTRCKQKALHCWSYTVYSWAVDGLNRQPRIPSPPVGYSAAITHTFVYEKTELKL